MIPSIGEKIPSVREIISCKGAKIPNYTIKIHQNRKRNSGRALIMV